jgi:hypothetical protein
MSVKDVSRKTYTQPGVWDEMIGETEAKLLRAKALVRRLRGAVKIFKQQKANREPLPRATQN